MVAPFYSDPVQLAAARAKYLAKMYPEPPKPKPVKRDYIFVATKPLKPKKPIAEIIRDVAAAFGCTSEEIIGQRRSPSVVSARFAAYHAAVNARPDMSLTQIAYRFGRRDHTTLLSALRKMDRIGVPQPSVSTQKQGGC